MADIFHFEPPAQSKTHQFIVQFVLILRMHALALYRQQIIQYGKIFILVDFIQVTVKYTLGNFLQLKRLSYLYLPPLGKAVLIMNEGTAKTFLVKYPELVTKLAENRLQMQEEVKAKGEKLAKLRAEGK